MYRAAFLALGLFLIQAGGGCLFVVDIELSDRVPERLAPAISLFSVTDSEGHRHLRPPDWFPFSMMGLGMITTLYAIALPRE